MTRMAFVLLGLLLTSETGLAQGRLERIRLDMGHARPPDPTPASPPTTNQASSPWFTAEQADGLAILAGGVLGAPFYVPMFLLNDHGENTRKAQFPSYPYPGDYPGYLWMGRDPLGRQMDPPDPPPDLRSWSLRLAVEDGDDFRGTNRLGLRAVFDTTSRLGLSSNWDWFQETLARRMDSMVLGDANVTFRFAQDELLQFVVGMGGRCALDSQQMRGGFNITYGCDFTAFRPLVVSTEADAGNLSHAGVVHARGSFGAVYQHYEILAGYDFLRIGSVNLQGPFMGVRFWF